MKTIWYTGGDHIVMICVRFIWYTTINIGINVYVYDFSDENSLKQEASSMYKLSFTNVVTMFGIVSSPNLGFFSLVMEYMELGSLAELNTVSTIFTDFFF